MNDRIVIAGEFWFGASGAGLAHGFRQLGWEVSEVDIGSHTISGRTPALRVAARLLHGQSVASYNAAILQEVENAQPRAFLTVKGALIQPQTLAAIRKRGVVTVNYYPDYHFAYAGLDPESFQHYDLFFTTKSFQVDYLRKLIGASRVRFLHHGYSSLVHRPLARVDVSEREYVADVLYVGNHSSYKQAWMKEIAARVPEARLMVVGSGWEAAPFAAFPQVAINGKVVVGDSYAGLLQRARINVAIHSGKDASTGWEDLVSTRTFEISACKGFMLHIDNPEVRTLFEPGSQIAVFAEPGQLAAEIRKFLAAPGERRQMIERAYARCVPAYSYDSRAEELTRLIAGVPAQHTNA